MGYILLLTLLGLTTLGAYGVGSKGLGLSGGSVRGAIGKMLECVGMTFVFFVGNLAGGVVLVAATRVLTGRFVSPYVMADEALLISSLLQALTFQWWRETSASANP